VPTRKVTSEKRRATRGDRASSARRNELVQIATELFATQGYQGTSVRDIAEQADILSGSLFHHFKSKESILEEIVGTHFAEMVNRCEEISKSGVAADQALAGIIRTSIALVQENPLEARIVQRDWHDLIAMFPEFSQNADRYAMVWLAVLKQGVADGLFRSDLDLEIAYRMIRGAVAEITNWYRPRGAKYRDAVVDNYTAVLLGGLRIGKSPLDRQG
jgi:TetR/AcrR family transcriptional regulator, cholesterol catabolism regulator